MPFHERLGSRSNTLGMLLSVRPPQAWAIADRLDLIGPAMEQPEYNLFERQKVRGREPLIFTQQSMCNYVDSVQAPWSAVRVLQFIVL
jgi:hypothetical protein